MFLWWRQKITTSHISLDHAVAQMVSCQSLNMEAWVQSKASQCWIYGQSGFVTGSAQSTSALHCQYHLSHTTSANLSNWQCHCINHFLPPSYISWNVMLPLPTYVHPCTHLKSTSQSVHMKDCSNKTSLATSVSAWVAPTVHRTESKNKIFLCEVFTALPHNMLHAFTKLQKTTISFVM